MVRELKFRAWDNVKMLLNVYPTDKSRECYNFKASEFYKCEAVMQYTGLKDKNGVEIYEGDIVTPSAYKKLSKPQYKCEIIFHKGMFCLKPNNGFINDYRPLFRALNMSRKAGNDYEVIGNVFENKELLNDN